MASSEHAVTPVGCKVGPSSGEVEDSGTSSVGVTLPASPKNSLTHFGAFWMGLLGAPCQFTRFVAMLYQTFGAYVPTVVLQYGMNQGIGMSYGNMARRVYFADVLHLDGAVSTRYFAAAMLPWSVKPIFGILSDAMPICGYHRSPYLVIAGASGLIAWTALGALPLTGVATVPFFLLVNISVCMPDVMVDGSTAELTKDKPTHAANLQSLSWGALGIGGLVTCSTSGFLVDTFGPRNMFLFTNLFSLGILVPGLLNWLGDRKESKDAEGLGVQWLRKNAVVSLLAAYMSITALTLSLLQVFVESKAVRGSVTVAIAVILVVGVFAVLKPVSSILAKTATFIFMRECFQLGGGEVMFQWLKNYEGGPQFSPTVLSWIDCFGSVGLLAGITLYNKFLSEVPYRKIFLFAQMAMLFPCLFDLVLVKRWNLTLGIPDIVMLIGDDAFTVTMRRFFTMPMFILAAKVCPDSIEATLFAMLMALSNFGATVAEFIGTSLFEAFGVVHGNFDHFPNVIISKALFRILPMFIIPFLVPNLRPSDPIPLGSSASHFPKATTDEPGSAEPSVVARG